MPSNNQHPQCESFVLAGGRSSRMGQEKALLRLQNRTLLEIALDKLTNPRIAGARADLAHYAPVLPDLHPDCGPLGGIESALHATTQPLNLFLPLDVPLLPAAFLNWMLQRAHQTGARATVPRVNGRAQPLCAVYHIDLLPGISRAIAQADYKVLYALRGYECDLFDIEQVASANPQLHTYSAIPMHRWFHNCNTPHDMVELENALVLSQ